LLAGLAADQPMTLFADEWRTPLEVRAAARAIVELAATDAAGVLHLGGADRVTRAELGRRALDAIGWAGPRPAEGSRRDFAVERPEDTSLASTAAQARLSFPLPGLEVGLADWARDRGVA
ncbi:MAG: sugar nucleotide-binding protein, partial [Planctomycetota bacterium]